MVLADDKHTPKFTWTAYETCGVVTTSETGTPRLEHREQVKRPRFQATSSANSKSRFDSQMPRNREALFAGKEVRRAEKEVRVLKSAESLSRKIKSSETKVMGKADDKPLKRKRQHEPDEGLEMRSKLDTRLARTDHTSADDVILLQEFVAANVDTYDSLSAMWRCIDEAETRTRLESSGQVSPPSRSVDKAVTRATR